MPSTEEMLARSRAQWTVAADTWDREGDELASATRPVTEGLLEVAGLASGMRVLDVAGGTGDPSLSLATRVAPGGRVVCLDLTPAMLAGARRRLTLAGHDAVRLVAASAEGLPFPDGTFDAVVSRFGVMLFADPARAIGEMARVARPGATIAAAVWGPPDRNPYLSLPMGVLLRVGGVPPPDPTAPGVFRLAAPGSLASLLTQAGLRDVREERRPFALAGTIPLDDFWSFLLRVAAPLRAAVEALDGAVRERVAAGVRAEVAPFFTGSGMRFPSEMILGSGVRA